MRRHPTTPVEAGLCFALGSHLYFPLMLLYQCQHGKHGAKTGAALLNYNQKSGMREAGHLGTAQVPPRPHASAPAAGSTL